MILDPTFKITFWRNNESFINDQYGMSVPIILCTFSHAAQSFVEAHVQTSKPAPKPSDTETNTSTSFFTSALYKPAPKLDGIQAEISVYLKEDPEPEGTKPLAYWSTRQKKFPLLSSMARVFLAIPVTSASSERVFSKGRRVISWQRAALKPKTVEQLLCLKSWFQAFDGPF